MDYTCLCNCENCDLKGSKIVHPYIPPTPMGKILFVGQAPGKTEKVTGVPFTGSAGRMLYACLISAGIDKRKVYITHLVSCFPGVDKKGNDLTPTPREISYCNKRLIQEVLDIKPDLIVALGGPALYELTGQEGILTARGQFFNLREKFNYTCPVLACLHPSYVMRQRQWMETAVKDFKEINNFRINGVPPEEKDYKFLMDPSPEELFNYLHMSDTLAFDTETTGLNPRVDHVIGASFSNSYYSAAAVLFRPGDPRIEVMRKVLSDPSIKKITQNGSFDCSMLECDMGIKVEGLDYDTRLAEQLMNPDMPTNLDHLRAVYTKIKAYKPPKKEMKTIQHWGKDKTLTYANWDAVATFQVAEEQKKKLTSGQLNLLRTLLIPLVPALNSMTNKGVLVDIDTLAGKYAINIPKLKALEEDVKERVGINPHSPKQVAEHFNITSTGRKDLEYYINRGDPRGPDMQLVLDCRDLKKESSTYLKGLFDRLEYDEKGNGYVHTNYDPSGTGTGRLSSSNPNLQNQPKPIRVLFIAEPGKYLVSGDYKQLELWVGSIIAPCGILRQDLTDGVDVHSMIAKEIEPYVPQRLKHRVRLLAKTIVFGTFYGRGARSIAIEFGCSTSQAEEWQAICFKKYPGLIKYVKDRYNDYQTTKTVTTPWGRHRVISSPTQAFNTPVQSSASDITMSSLVKMYQEGFDLRLTVHDEIVWQCNQEDLHQSIIAARDILSRPIPQLDNNQFPVTFKYGTNWYDMEDYTL